MIWNSDIAKLPIRDMQARYLDLVLAEIGMKRRPASAKYARTLPRSVQKFELLTRSRDDVVYIFGKITIQMPEVDVFVDTLTAGNENIRTGDTIWATLGSIGPERSYQEWPTRTLEDVEVAGAALADHLRLYVLPFLTAYTDHEAIIRNGLRDDRHFHGETFTVVLAAAYLMEGQRNVARTLIEARYGNALGLRRRFQSVFNYFDSKDT